jgi:hypothetical protein
MSAPGPSCRRSFSPLGRWLLVPAAQTQQALRRCFARWGLPRAVRVDNGAPWGSCGHDLPTDLALWLIGLGVEVIWNDPHSPQQNGVVERSQGTGKRWADPGSCDSAGELQAAADEMDRLQRQEHPAAALGGLSRMEAHPGLAHSGRAYSEEREEASWDHGRALLHLAGYCVPRRVGVNGDVWLYHRPRYVGVAHRGKEVFVMLDPHRREWAFADKDGRQLRCQPADELSAQRIRSLDVNSRD